MLVLRSCLLVLRQVFHWDLGLTDWVRLADQQASGIPWSSPPQTWNTSWLSGWILEIKVRSSSCTASTLSSPPPAPEPGPQPPTHLLTPLHQKPFPQALMGPVKMAAASETAALRIKSAFQVCGTEFRRLGLAVGGLFLSIINHVDGDFIHSICTAFGLLCFPQLHKPQPANQSQTGSCLCEQSFAGA